MRLGSLALALIGVAACGDRRESSPEREPQAQRRVIEPPLGTVRPLPPYVIQGDRVGPYKLGEKIAALLDHLPSGPRIERLEIPNLLHHSLIRAEDATVLIGGEPNTTLSSSLTTFVAVVGGEVARTESGIHVGSTRDELVRALGQLVEDPERARDPRLAVPTSLRNSRFVLDDARNKVVAIIVTGDPSTSREPSNETICPRPASTMTAFGSCLTGAGELVELDEDRGELTIRSSDNERTLASLRIPNIVFAAPLRNPADGRDELVAIARTDEPGQRTWSLVAYRYEGGKYIRIVEPSPLYQLSGAQTRWIGADLRDVDLYLELTSHLDGIEVGGILTTHAKDKIRDVVVISPNSVPRRRGKSASAEAGDAGVADAEVSDTPALPRSGTGSAKL